MRVSKESENVGLDISQHDESYNFADIDEIDDDGQLPLLNITYKQSRLAPNKARRLCL